MTGDQAYGSNIPPGYEEVLHGSRVGREAYYWSPSYSKWRPVGENHVAGISSNRRVCRRILTQTTTNERNQVVNTVTIAHTPKAVAGQVAPTEEILVQPTAVSSSNSNDAILQVAVMNAEAIAALLKTSTFKVVVQQIGG